MLPQECGRCNDDRLHTLSALATHAIHAGVFHSTPGVEHTGSLNHFWNEGSMNFRIFFCHSIDHWIKSPGSSSLHLPTVDRHETDSVAPDEGWLEIAGPMLFICYCCGLKFVCRAVYRPLFSLMHLSWNRFPSNNSPSSVDNLLSGFRWLLSFYLLLLRSVYDSS